MKARLILFLFLGAMTGAAVSLLASLAMLPPVATGMPPQDPDPYVSVLAHGAAFGALLGLIHGLLLFRFTLGETPIIERRSSLEMFKAGGLATRFDYRRFGSKILPISFVFGLLLAFLVMPLISDPSVVGPRSPIVRVLACFIFALI